MQHKDIVEFYAGFLSSLGLEVNEAGAITYDGVPLRVDDKVLVMPTKEKLKNPNWDAEIAFHPLAENPLHGESEVLQTIRTWANYHYNVVLVQMLDRLVEEAVDTDRHKLYKGKSADFLSIMPDANARTLKDVRSVIGKIDPRTPRRMLSIFLKRGGKFHEKEVRRLCTVRAPILEERENTDRTIYDVKFRKADFEPILDVIENVLLPNVDMQAFDTGSNSNSAPFFETMAGTMHKLSKHINKLRTKYKHAWDTDLVAKITFDTSWYDNLGEAISAHAVIPALKGNSGRPDPEGTHAPEDTGKAINTVVSEKPKFGGEAPVNTQTSSTEPKKKSFADKVEEQNKRPLFNTSAFGTANQNTGFGQPAQPEPQRNASGKVNFNDMFSGNSAFQTVRAPQQRGSSWENELKPVQQQGGFAGTGFGRQGQGW